MLFLLRMLFVMLCVPLFVMVDWAAYHYLGSTPGDVTAAISIPAVIYAVWRLSRFDEDEVDRSRPTGVAGDLRRLPSVITAERRRSTAPARRTRRPDAPPGIEWGSPCNTGFSALDDWRQCPPLLRSRQRTSFESLVQSG
jgi:hypothetical protein